MATDGTTEAKMVAFDAVATRIIGKPVQQLMRAGRPNEDFPPDIAAVVSLKFTFAVGLADESYKSRDKSYRVLSVLASQGRQPSVPGSVITASTSRVQAQATGSHQKQTVVEGEILEASAETEVPKCSATKQTPATAAQATSKTMDLLPQPSHETPVPSNVITLPSFNSVVPLPTIDARFVACYE